MGMSLRINGQVIKIGISSILRLSGFLRDVLGLSMSANIKCWLPAPIP